MLIRNAAKKIYIYWCTIKFTMSKTTGIKLKKCQLIKYTYRYKQIGDTIHTLESTIKWSNKSIGRKKLATRI